MVKTCLVSRVRDGHKSSTGQRSDPHPNSVSAGFPNLRSGNRLVGWVRTELVGGRVPLGFGTVATRSYNYSFISFIFNMYWFSF
jgi:hypothetical protein